VDCGASPGSSLPSQPAILAKNENVFSGRNLRSPGHRVDSLPSLSTAVGVGLRWRENAGRRYQRSLAVNRHGNRSGRERLRMNAGLRDRFSTACTCLLKTHRARCADVAQRGSEKLGAGRRAYVGRGAQKHPFVGNQKCDF